MFQPRPYQTDIAQKAAEILFANKLVYLAMECRTGKTSTAMMAAINTGAKGVLFLTPKKAIPSIERDYHLIRDYYDELKKENRFIFKLYVTNYENVLAKEKSAYRYARREVETLYPDISIKGVKYTRLVEQAKARHMEKIAPYLFGDWFDTIIIDEAHRMGSFPKPSGSQMAVRKLARGKNIIFLSGTPSPESYSQLFHQLQISDHSPWSAYRNFYSWCKAGYVNVQPKMINGTQSNDYTDANLDKVKHDIDHLTISFTQDEAGFEVEVIERVARITMQPSTEAIIKQLRKDRVATIPSTSPLVITADTPADLLNKMHQLAGGTLKVSDTERLILDTSKADYLARFFSGKHYAIFYVYKAERDLLIATLGEAVTESPEEFQSDMTKIFIGQIRSVREGVRLDSAEFSVFYSTEYSYVSYAQGLQRIASRDRTAPAIAYFLVSQCRIEQSILDAVHSKQDFTLAWFNRH